MKISIPQRLRPRKTLIVLGAALGIGMLAAVVAYGYLARQLAAIEARAKGEMVPVLVAKHDLSKGMKLNRDTVAIRNVPRDYAHSVAVTPEQFERLDGQALSFPVKGGEMVLWGLVEGKKAPTFSARVENGRRAMTVPVDEINSISGMLEPGDMIDLMVTVSRKNKKHTVPLLQSVQVMATGQRSVDDPKSGERRSYSTVTLDTTPEQAHNIIVAREAGKITALLRNPQDRKTMQTSQVDLAALLGTEENAIAIEGGRHIPILYGGTKLKEEDIALPRPVLPAATARADPPGNTTSSSSSATSRNTREPAAAPPRAD